MRNVVLAGVGLSVAILASIPVIIGDAEGRIKLRPPFRVVFIDQIGSRNEKSRLLVMATKAEISAIRRELAADTPLANKLRARGIKIRNVVGRQMALDGRTVFYVR